MSFQSTESMERALNTFLDGTRTTAEEKLMLGMLVCDCSYVLLISLNGLFKLDYRKKVLANQAAMTPFLRNVYKVLTDWNKTGAAPWETIDRTKYIPHSAPVAGPSTTPPVVQVTPPPNTTNTTPLVSTTSPPPAQSSTAVSPADIPVVTIPPLMQPTTLVTEARKKGKGKGKEKEVVAENLAPPQSKHWKVSPLLVPTHHLETEDSEATPATDKPADIAVVNIPTPVRATLRSTRISRDACKGKPKLIMYKNIENIYTPCKGKPKRKV
jgi:hypothetical protein